LLYTESKQYLIDKLKAAGIKSKPFTTEKALEKSQESHIGAVLFERETFTRNGSKKRYRDEEGTLHKRRKIMERATTFGVIIGGYMVEKARRALPGGILFDAVSETVQCLPDAVKRYSTALWRVLTVASTSTATSSPLRLRERIGSTRTTHS